MEQIYPSHAHLEVFLVCFSIFHERTLFFLQKLGEIFDVRFAFFARFLGNCLLFHGVLDQSLHLLIKTLGLLAHKLVKLVKFALVLHDLLAD